MQIEIMKDFANDGEVQIGGQQQLQRAMQLLAFPDRMSLAPEFPACFQFSLSSSPAPPLEESKEYKDWWPVSVSVDVGEGSGHDAKGSESEIMEVHHLEDERPCLTQVTQDARTLPIEAMQLSPADGAGQGAQHEQLGVSMLPEFEHSDWNYSGGEEAGLGYADGVASDMPPLDFWPMDEGSLPSISQNVLSGASSPTVGMRIDIHPHILNKMINEIKIIIQKYHKQGAPASSNGQTQAHEVVLVLLLAPTGSRLCGILQFSNKDGNEMRERSEYFKAINTRLMGKIWQGVKKNKDALFDTFARAMRNDRERDRGHFDYHCDGKGAKKRIYKLGINSTMEFDRMELAINTVIHLE